MFLGLKRLDRLRGLFVSAHIRAGAVPRTEDASGAAVGCPQSVESAVLRAFEDESRTVGGRFRYRISLPYRRSLFLVRCASENASHLVVRSTGKRVAVASERPVYPRTWQRQVAAAAEPGVHFSRPHSGHEVATQPQR